MNELTNEKLMTVKEVAEVLGVSRQLISEKVKYLFPEIVRNGVETKLNEKHVTVIKLSVEKNPMLPSTTVEGMLKTNLEKALLIKQAMQFQDELIYELQSENEKLKNSIFQAR